MHQFYAIVITALAISCLGCTRVTPSRPPKDQLVQISIASLHYASERNGLPFAHLFTLPFAFRRILRDEDSLRALDSTFAGIRCQYPKEYGHDDADLSIALEWRSGRHDTLSFRNDRMMIEGHWCELDTALLFGVRGLLSEEHKGAIDTFLYYLRQYPH